MSKAANARNFGNGKNLTHYRTRQNIGEEVCRSKNRGSATRDKIISALGHLGRYLHHACGHRNMEKATAEQMSGFAEHLRGSGLSTSTASSYISAINKVAEFYGREDLTLSASNEGLGRGTKYRNENLSTRPEERESFRSWLHEKEKLTGDNRYEALSHSVALQAAAGLRMRESARISPMNKSVENGRVALGRQDGTKNARVRKTSVLNPGAFACAAEFQRLHPEYGRSMIPDGMTQQQYLDWAQDVMKAYALETGRDAPGYHGNRHWFAQERYAQEMEARTGVRIDCPVRVGVHRDEHILHIAERAGISFDEARRLDENVRAEIAEDLGHSRVDITRAYLGD